MALVRAAVVVFLAVFLGAFLTRVFFFGMAFLAFVIGMTFLEDTGFLAVFFFEVFLAVFFLVATGFFLAGVFFLLAGMDFKVLRAGDFFFLVSTPESPELYWDSKEDQVIQCTEAGLWHTIYLKHKGKNSGRRIFKTLPPRPH